MMRALRASYAHRLCEGTGTQVDHALVGAGPEPVRHRVDNTEVTTQCRLCGLRHGLGNQNRCLGASGRFSAGHSSNNFVPDPFWLAFPNLPRLWTMRQEILSDMTGDGQ